MVLVLWGVWPAVAQRLGQPVEGVGYPGRPLGGVVTIQGAVDGGVLPVSITGTVTPTARDGGTLPVILEAIPSTYPIAKDGGVAPVSPADYEISSTCTEACFGTAAADGGLTTLSLTPGKYRMTCSADSCLNLAAEEGAGRITACAAGTALAPGGFRVYQGQPEIVQIKSTSATLDAGPSDAAVYTAASVSGAACCRFCPLQ